MKSTSFLLVETQYGVVNDSQAKMWRGSEIEIGSCAYLDKIYPALRPTSHSLHITRAVFSFIPTFSMPKPVRVSQIILGRVLARLFNPPQLVQPSATRSITRLANR